MAQEVSSSASPAPDVGTAGTERKRAVRRILTIRFHKHRVAWLNGGYIFQISTWWETKLFNKMARDTPLAKILEWNSKVMEFAITTIMGNSLHNTKSRINYTLWRECTKSMKKTSFSGKGKKNGCIRYEVHGGNRSDLGKRARLPWQPFLGTPENDFMSGRGVHLHCEI